MKFSRPLPALALCALAVAAHGADHGVIFESNVPMKTRDGVTLVADIYRPAAEGQFPVILTRTPYDKYTNLGMGLAVAQRGYVGIIQDVRGRYRSGGEWYPFKHEAADGYDAVEWAAALPYANGKVALVGGSYVGVTVMQAAVAAPPHLVAIAPSVTASNYHEHWVYNGGAFMQLLNQAWSSVLSIDAITRRAAGSANPGYWDYRRPISAYPVIDKVSNQDVAPYYADWVAHPDYDDYWKQWAIDERYDQITVPALHEAAWYDLFQQGSIQNYVGIKTHGANAAARAGQRLVIRPGGHAGNGPKIGEVDFGPGSAFDMWDYTMRWFDHYVKGEDNGIDREKPVKLFVMGRNAWRDEGEWPLARTRYTRYHLRSGGRANSVAGDGILAVGPPGGALVDSYVSDPHRPVATHGGAILGDEGRYIQGPLDQRENEQRSDVLVYTTPVLTEDTEVTGPLAVELYVSSSAVDTDFTAKLVDVHPDGRAINLADGIKRARYRDSREYPELMQPGAIYKLTIDLGSTANVFLAGHRIRLEIASSNFPRFDRNPQTGGRDDGAAPFATATNVIHHDRDHPSAIILPIIPSETNP
ncbi:MAG: CocE/NonD family hydrolase [Opitutaceae bacterium]|nr:CocE/NonD family hydrolase [Cephaloticoccus sp.]MCP5529289.1 CocE/NonD family hydrolase [Opitutaceae bacterium]